MTLIVLEMSHSFIHSFIQLIENTPPLSPLELHTLAVAYEKQKPGSGMGNHLAFIALNAIYTNPSIQQVLSNPSPDFAIDPCGPLCALGAGGVAHCKCPPVKTNDEVKRVRHADLELLIEVTTVDGNTTFTILAVTATSSSN